MLSKILYASLFKYSPRGKSFESRTSQKLPGIFKNANSVIIDRALIHYSQELKGNFADFLNSEITLVPVPRSAPLAPGALWPSEVIANQLIKHGYGKEVSTCLQRIKAIPKSSSSYTAASRPTVEMHLQSLSVTPGISEPSQITLIDDVLTLGRTAYTCADKLHEAFPNADIRIFTMIRTKGMELEIDNFLDPFIGEITFNASSGKVSRSD